MSSTAILSDKDIGELGSAMFSAFEAAESRCELAGKTATGRKPAGALTASGIYKRLNRNRELADALVVILEERIRSSFPERDGASLAKEAVELASNYDNILAGKRVRVSTLVPILKGFGLFDLADTYRQIESNKVEFPSGTVTFLFTDVVGYGDKINADPEGAARIARRLEGSLSDLARTHHGAVFKTEGDAIAAAFGSGAEALKAAAAMQNAMADHAWRIRIGVNTGDCAPENGDYHGQAVNLAARLRDMASGGETLIGDSTSLSVGSWHPEGCRLTRMGSTDLKSFPGTVYHRLDVGRQRPARLAAQQAIFDDYLECFGREDEIRKVLDWMDVEPNARGLVVAPAGVGKTAFMAELDRRLERRPEIEVHSFYFRAGDSSNGYDTFKGVIPDRLLTEKPEAGKRVILLDGLDEAEQPIGALELRPVSLAESVYVLASVRFDSETETSSEHVPPAFGSPLEALVVLGHLRERRSIEDWLEAASDGSFSREELGEVAATLLEKTDGYPLYLSFLLIDLHEMRRSKDGRPLAERFRRYIENSPRSGGGVSGFEHYVLFAWNRIKEECRDLADLLPLVAAAKRDLTIGGSPWSPGRGGTEVEALMAKLGQPAYVWHTLPRELKRWLRSGGGFGRKTVGFAYDILRDLFLSHDEFKERAFSANKMLVDFAVEHHKDWSYAAEFLPEHLAEQTPPAQNRLGKLWRDIEFQSKRFGLIGPQRFEACVKDVDSKGLADPTFGEAAKICRCLRANFLAMRSEADSSFAFLQEVSNFAIGTEWQELAQSTLVSGDREWYGLTNPPAMRVPAYEVVEWVNGAIWRSVVSAGGLFLGLVDGRIARLDLQNRRLAWVKEAADGDGVGSLAAQDGLVYSGHQSGQIKVWQGEKFSRDLLEEPDGYAVLSLEVAEGGIVYSGHGSGQIKLWKGEELPVDLLEVVDGDSVLSLSAAENGLLYSGHKSGLIKRWKGVTRLPDLSETEDHDEVWCLAATEGGFVYSGHKSGRIKLWDGEKAPKDIVEDPEKRAVVTLSAVEGGTVYSGHSSGVINVWSGEEFVGSIQEPDADLVSSVATRDGFVYSVHFTTGQIRLYDSENFSVLGEDAGGDGVVALAGTESGLIYSGHVSGQIKVWQGEKFLRDLLEVAEGDAVCSFAATKGLVYCGHASGRITVWDGIELKDLRNEADGDEVYCLAATKKGFVYSGHESGQVRLWNGEKFRDLLSEPKDGTAWSLAVTDDDRVYSGHESGQIKLWDGERLVMDLPGESKGDVVFSLASPGGGLFYGGHWSGQINIWEGEEFKGVLKEPDGDIVYSLAAREGFVCGGHRSGKVLCWVADGGSYRRTTICQGGSCVTGVVLSGDGGIVTGHFNGDLLFWHLRDPTGKAGALPG